MTARQAFEIMKQAQRQVKDAEEYSRLAHENLAYAQVLWEQYKEQYKNFSDCGSHEKV